MQEETTQKTISLVIKGGKIDAHILKARLKFFLSQAQKQKAKGQAKKATPVKGKQTL